MSRLSKGTTNNLSLLTGKTPTEVFSKLLRIKPLKIYLYWMSYRVRTRTLQLENTYWPTVMERIQLILWWLWLFTPSSIPDIIVLSISTLLIENLKLPYFPKITSLKLYSKSFSINLVQKFKSLSDIYGVFCIFPYFIFILKHYYIQD